MRNEIEPEKANSSDKQEGDLVAPAEEEKTLASIGPMQKKSCSSLTSMPCERASLY